jgi:hypothetical protein
MLLHVCQSLSQLLLLLLRLGLLLTECCLCCGVLLLCLGLQILQGLFGCLGCLTGLFDLGRRVCCWGRRVLLVQLQKQLNFPRDKLIQLFFLGFGLSLKGILTAPQFGKLDIHFISLILGF